jgi:clan AA aspartic protease
MLRGRVNKSGEPLVALTLELGRKRRRQTAVIDTGFNGYLSVPKSLIEQADWELLGFEDYELASGAIVREQVYRGWVIFDRRRVEVYAVATDSSDILIGTRLLRGKRLLIDFGSGEVYIMGSRG